jgi:hypothetical protein
VKAEAQEQEVRGNDVEGEGGGSILWMIIIVT